ncbi:cupin domain-containing protein [Pistricoccus aurantiacus]|uniref:Cupin domain-containing protein n=1 Tax=Pistricoccus aurantiacus TaxID=1883414 RepID=A0A5B8SZB1_9GAMM|nr:cupin domain-containing protein [Pistricoccus aurantiacus]QEA40140.1 cupin domain-containing protein [Pistricoccus aurantiacus]
MERAQATSHLQIENSQVLVTRWDFPPGSETGWHRHGHDYVIVPITDGKMRLETLEGNRDVILEAGVCYSRVEGTEHNVINDSDSFFSFVEVEIK